MCKLAIPASPSCPAHIEAAFFIIIIDWCIVLEPSILGYWVACDLTSEAYRLALVLGHIAHLYVQLDMPLAWKEQTNLHLVTHSGNNISCKLMNLFKDLMLKLRKSILTVSHSAYRFSFPYPLPRHPEE